MPETRLPVIDGPWVRGIDSLSDPLYAPQATVQWSVNTLNRGGIYQTRPGYSILKDSDNSNIISVPRGLTAFKPKGSTDPILVKAVGTRLVISRYPYTSWSILYSTLDNMEGPVWFETCVKGATTLSDGTLTVIDPYPVLMVSTGVSKTLMWDGTTVTALDPTNDETPVCTHMQWMGNRLWIAKGSQVWASNILEPDKFTEIQGIAGGGALTFPADITGMGGTASLKSLLVFTDSTTSSVQAQILARESWGDTPDFQKVIFPDIGCIAHRSIINQYGMTWWYAAGGLMNLDEAETSYRSSKLHFKDELMARSKTNMFEDRSGIASGSFGNFMMVSTPSGDIWNAHTWVMDESVIDTPEGSTTSGWASCWTGTRPVQWVSTVVRGQPRVFFLSNDEWTATPLSIFHRSNVYEAFCARRKDWSVDDTNTVGWKNIDCSVETKYLSPSTAYSAFDFVELMVSELSGEIDLEVSYASRHGGYKTVLGKHIVATTDSLNQTLTVLPDDLSFNMKQRRRVRTYANEARLADDDAGVEDADHTRNVDKGFTILVAWEGELALENLIVNTNPVTDSPTGKFEVDEEDDRYVKSDGTNFILSTEPVTSTLVGGRTSSAVGSCAPRCPEFPYKSTL
jgi:hypothetical protein